jgi:hypothetical protein
VVERTISWLSRRELLSQEIVRLPTRSEALIFLISMRLLLVRVA